MPHVRRGTKDHLRHLAQGTKSGAAGFGPALPAVVEPPIVMMQHQRQVAGGALPDQLPGQQEIAAETLVVRPDQAIRRRQSREVTGPETAQLLAQRGLRARLFGQIAEHGINPARYAPARQPGPKTVEPGRVRRLARGEDEFGPGRGQLAQQMRRGQFNDAPHAAGAKVIMHDDKFHSRQCFMAAPAGRPFFRADAAKLDGHQPGMRKFTRAPAGSSPRAAPNFESVDSAERLASGSAFLQSGWRQGQGRASKDHRVNNATTMNLNDHV
ncbi:MAG: hypothetical protein BWX84_01457 [Verrucomicrobia bacterium ADurb.Bin118]|nr:MAG: hypothetical protein BWX84_01457 [Verrucomicrobia bacterium ADurb.Bin118]